MKAFARIAAAVALAGAFSVSMAQAAGDTQDVPLQDYSVYVDTPTGFVFVKLPQPQGWKFVGKVEHDSVASLPPTVLTDLLGAGSEVATSGERHRS